MNTRSVNGQLFVEGVFRGDDETATKVIVREVGQVNTVTLDPSGSEGPFVVKYDCDPTTTTGTPGFVVEDLGGTNFFEIDNQGKTRVLEYLTAATPNCFDPQLWRHSGVWSPKRAILQVAIAKF